MATPFGDDQIRIVDFPPTSLAVLAHRGDPALIGETIRRFVAWRIAAGLMRQLSATFNILHADPETTAPEHYRVDVCAATDRPVAPNDQGITAGHIPGGRCAVLRVTGTCTALRPAWNFLYADWLPRSGEVLRDFPMFQQLVRFFPDVQEQDAVTDLFLPLE